MKKLLYNIIVTKGTPLTNNNSEYKINGVTYNVTSLFDMIDEENDTLTNRLFRIVDTQNAHLMAEDNTDTINNEYTCLTAGMEDLCSQ